MKKPFVLTLFCLFMAYFGHSQEIEMCQPAFPGGLDSLQSFIALNLNNPIQDSLIESRVVISFMVGKTGLIKRVKIVEDDHKCKGCAEEAIRVVKSMPKWEPMLVKGKPKRVQYILPVLFKVE